MEHATGFEWCQFGDLDHVPWIHSPLETGQWRKVRSLSGARFGSKSFLARNGRPEADPRLPGVFAVKRTEKPSDNELVPRDLEFIVTGIRGVLAVQERCGRCVNVSTTHGIWQDQRYIYTVTEHCDRGDVFTMWANQPKASKAKASCDMVRQMLLGLAELHAHGFAHMDVCLENFYVTSQGLIKLAEFSQVCRISSLTLQDAQLRWTESDCRTGGPMYKPPELMRFDGSGGAFSAAKADCFQVGVAIFTLMVGTYPALPWASNSDQPAGAAIHMAERFDLSRYKDQLSPQCRDLLEQMMAPRPEQRPTVKRALEHSWLNEYGASILSTILA